MEERKWLTRCLSTRPSTGVIGYLHEEEEDYECSSRSRRRNHIWRAVKVLMRYREEQREATLVPADWREQWARRQEAILSNAMADSGCPD